MVLAPQFALVPGVKFLARLALPLVLLLGAPVAALAQWDTPNRAFHKTASFPLEGRHLTVACASCHIKGVVQGTPTTCYDCHWLRRQDDPYRTRLGSACEQCHRPTAWTAAKWDHGAATGMPLNASHKTLGCDTCHKNALFSGVTLGCATCHQKDYDATTRPAHKASGFSTDCAGCHKASDTTFDQAHFDHNAVFPLVGPHAVQDCTSCHAKGVYKGTPRDCLGCHRKDYDSSKTPNHAAAGFSTACETCHRPTDATWHNANINHSQYYPLVGLHATVGCASCHINNVYKGTPTDCVGCHRKDYDATKSPNHAASGLGTACASCHKATDPAWQGSNFNHAQYYPLVGLHATVACGTCHVNGVYKGTTTDCVGCHRKDYDATKNPPHAASGLGTACASCHKATDASWQGSNFNHSQFYPLVGVHATQLCSACHVNGAYAGTPTDCLSCHRKDYDASKNPNHAASGFSTTCDSCHKNTDPTWHSATFNHSQFFALQGVHATQACAACHINGVYKGTPRDCYTCHRTVYNATTNPNHAAAQFPTTCDSCHKVTDTLWSQGKFTHAAFPITSGRHSGNPCSACHTNPTNFTVFTCLTCHDRTSTDSKHKGKSGYRYDSAACYSCHPTGRAG